MFCLPCSYTNLLGGADWMAAVSEASLDVAYLIPWRGSHLTGATSSFTGALQPVDPSLMEWAWQSPPPAAALGTLLVTQVAGHWPMDSALVLVAVYHRALGTRTILM